MDSPLNGLSKLDAAESGRTSVVLIARVDVRLAGEHRQADRAKMRDAFVRRGAMADGIFRRDGGNRR